VSNDVTRDRGNDGKGKRCDAKDANHYEEKTVVVRRERRASWILSERSCEESGKGEGRRTGARKRRVGEGRLRGRKEEKKIWRLIRRKRMEVEIRASINTSVLGNDRQLPNAGTHAQQPSVTHPTLAHHICVDKERPLLPDPIISPPS
jgi:hypothetical protein